MEPTPEQKMAIQRLYENESLTENLTDTDARALLDWAQQQIVSDADGKMVQAAVSAANNSGQEGVQALLLSADTFLAQELSARANDSSARLETAPAENARQAPTDSDAPKLGTLSADAAPPLLGVSGQAAETSILAGYASAAASGPAPKPAAKTKKPRTKSRRKSKKK